MLIAGFGRRGHAVGDIPGVRFKVVKVAGPGALMESPWGPGAQRLVATSAGSLIFLGCGLGALYRGLGPRLFLVQGSC